LTSYAGTTTTRHQLTCGEDPPHVVIREWRYGPWRLRVDDDDDDDDDCFHALLIVNLYAHSLDSLGPRGHDRMLTACTYNLDKQSVWFYLVFVLQRDALWCKAAHGLAIACRPSVRLPLTLADQDHIGWNSSKIISRLIFLYRPRLRSTYS